MMTIQKEKMENPNSQNIFEKGTIHKQTEFRKINFWYFINNKQFHLKFVTFKDDLYIQYKYETLNKKFVFTLHFVKKTLND